MTDLTINDFNNICRFCLKQCNTPFNQDPVIPSIFFKLTNIEFEGNDELPTQVCPDCTRQVRDINFFRSLCLESHQELTRIRTEKRVKKEEPRDLDERDEPYELKYETNEAGGSRDVSQYQQNEYSQQYRDYQQHRDQQFRDYQQYREQQYRDYQQYEQQLQSVSPQFYGQYAPYDPYGMSHYGYRPEETYPQPANEYNLKCQLCGKVCFDRPALLGHLKQHKLKPVMEYPCDRCGLRFQSEYRVLVHQQKNLCDALHRCTICHEGFETTNYLRKHRKEHFTESNLFRCEYCNLNFAKYKSLRKHVTKVHKTKCNN